jgi:hypothetical protein
VACKKFETYLHIIPCFVSTTKTTRIRLRMVRCVAGIAARVTSICLATVIEPKGRSLSKIDLHYSVIIRICTNYWVKFIKML